ncbi:MAG TPA: lytic murein transglycosylase [Alphaproteobacteria bacterium]|nr:lytic murein transglycosylase [Alphaproteobacteria bacterium]
MERRRFMTGLAGLGAAVGLASRAAMASSAEFKAWLDGVRSEAQRRGLSKRAIDVGLVDVAPIPRIIELDRRQPETTLTFSQYMERVVPLARIEAGRAQLVDNRDLLARVSARFNVQPQFIVALWAVETDYGRITGGFPVIAALATLAYDGRRSAFFREELFNALKIVDRGHVDPREMRGSWAGAMGQNQFMPSSYLSYAIDFDGDGKADIWTSRADVFASSANYLSRVGWRGDEGWGRVVRLPEGFDTALIDHTKVQKPTAEWRTLGVASIEGRALGEEFRSAGSLVQPGGADGPTYLVHANYRALLRWNRSLYFATAVGYLADQIDQS